MPSTKTSTETKHDGLLLNEMVRKLNDLGLDVTPRQLRHWDRNLLHADIDGSGYRRFNYDAVDKAISTFVLNKVLRISLSRIKNILAFMKSESELQEMLRKDPLSLLAKYKHDDGRERWYVKRELRDDIEAIEASLKKFKEAWKRFDEIYHTSKQRFYKEALKYQQANK